MIYSKKALNYKTMQLGEMVLTLEEAEYFLQRRRLYGDLKPELLKASAEAFALECKSLNKDLRKEK